MKNNRINRNSKILNQAIVLPFVTLAVVGFIFFLSSAYEPSWLYNWQDIRPEIKDTVKLIEKYGCITGETVGNNGKTPQQWHRRKWLMKNATESELTKLIDYPNGTVKATAYEGLIRKNNSDNYKLISEALNDTTTFLHYEAGCVGFPMLIGEYLVKYMISVSDRLPPLPPEKIIEYNLSETEIITLGNLYDERMNKKELYLREIYK
ncbi:MAG: hypothetical protein R2798_11965 [Chitinophagales bacterium]|nr:hypothetical protein [Bacteroidota bacterium]MCB9043620.1 hypothetical protein [Chitinophagales bacterium]